MNCDYARFTKESSAAIQQFHKTISSRARTLNLLQIGYKLNLIHKKLCNCCNLNSKWSRRTIVLSWNPLVLVWLRKFCAQLQYRSHNYYHYCHHLNYYYHPTLQQPPPAINHRHHHHHHLHSTTSTTTTCVLWVCSPFMYCLLWWCFVSKDIRGTAAPEREPEPCCSKRRFVWLVTTNTHCIDFCWHLTIVCSWICAGSILVMKVVCSNEYIDIPLHVSVH